MNTLQADLSFAFRQMRRAPGFTFITILTLALGIGAATAVFSVVDAVLLRPLPFAHQERLVFPNTRAQSGYTQPWSYPSYLDARAQGQTLAVLAGYNGFSKVTLELPSGPVSIQAVKGTDNFFEAFGIRPLLGRTFLPGEDQPGHDDVAVLSYELWQTEFAGRPQILGEVVRLDGSPYTVVGVMPRGFRFPLSAEKAIYTPLHPDPLMRNRRGSHWLRTVALLAPGVTLEQAQADLRNVFTNLGRANAETDAGRTVSLIPLSASISSSARPALKVLLLAVSALLAIACVNVAGLLLARGVKREREMAVRAAVGAARIRLIRQLLTESLCFSALGLAGGVVFSLALLGALRSYLVHAVERGAEVRLSLPVLGAALTIAALTGIIASVAPALRLSGLNPRKALHPSGGVGATRGQHRLRSAFVTTQVALSLVLLVISGVLLRDLHSLFNTDLGFEPGHVLTTAISLSPGAYIGRDPVTALYEPLLERVSHLGGVEAAGLINILPIQNWGSNSDVHITGQPPYPVNQEMLAETRLVTPGYFDVFGIKLLRGRSLTSTLDRPENAAPAVVVNQAFQRKFFSGGGDAIGAHIDDADKAENKTGIVGLVTNVRQDLHAPPLAEMDTLLSSVPWKDHFGYLANMTLVLRVKGDPAQVIPALRHTLHELDPTLPFITPETMTDIVKDSLVFERMVDWLFGIFAALALLLAVVGLFGLISHEVSLHTRDIGVRMALGSTRGRVAGEVLTRVGLLLTAGLVVGWVLTLALQKVMASVVVLRPGKDAVLLAGVTALLAACGLAAALRPAHIASSINPTEALRAE